MPISQENFLNEYAIQVLDGRAAIFAGAGLSIPAGLPSWKDLLCSFAAQIGLDINKETDFLSLMQFYLNCNSRFEINQHIYNALKNVSTPQVSHHLLAELPITTYWTTNYDCLLERAFEQVGKIYDVKTLNTKLAYYSQGQEIKLYKMHGDLADIQDFVITRRDYEAYFKKNELFMSKLKGDLCSYTFLFIGFSFHDPNLLLIMSQLKNELQNEMPKHYCIYKTLQQKDYDNKDEFQYAKHREELWIQDIEQYGIKIVPINNHEEIPALLKTLRRKVFSRSIFISGAVDDYTPCDWKAEDADAMLFSLTHALLAKRCKIITGCGLNVGSSIVRSVYDFQQKHKAFRIENMLTAFPFPPKHTRKEKDEATWEAYREEMVKHAGIALFLFGDKTLPEYKDKSKGMWCELKIAKQHNLIILPIAATGGTSAQIWEAVSSERGKYYPDERIYDAIKRLNDKHTDKALRKDLPDDIAELLQVCQNGEIPKTHTKSMEGDMTLRITPASDTSAKNTHIYQVHYKID